jgi:hypothetical protein
MPAKDNTTVVVHRLYKQWINIGNLDVADKIFFACQTVDVGVAARRECLALIYCGSRLSSKAGALVYPIYPQIDKM